HLEAEVRRERAVQEAERVWVTDLLVHEKVEASTHADRRRRPLADAICGDHCRVVEWRGIERARSVRDVMLAEHHRPAVFERAADLVPDPELDGEPCLRALLERISRP